MRFCVNGRQPYSVIKKANEIKFNYNDRDKIFDLVEKFPDKVVILDVPGDEEDWALWKMYGEKFEEFYIALHNLNRAKEFNDAGVKWYWPFPITTYYELAMIVNLHPSYLMIGPPLTFDLDNILNHIYDPTDSTFQIPLRMVVNVAHPAYLPLENTNGICGQWVRPEDAKLYSTRINCFEFDEVDLKQEEVLLHIYKDNQEWPGNLNLIIKKLNYDVDNRGLIEEVGKRRMTCGQRCWGNSNCHLCVSAFKFAEALKKEHIKRKQETAFDNN